MTMTTPAAPSAARRRAIDGARRPAGSTIWVLAAQAGICSAEERGRFVSAITALGESDRRDRLLLVTCHRAELLGTGPAVEAEALARSLGRTGPNERLQLMTGGTAVRHLLRLGAGLESTVIGEDQILHQVRELRESARRRPTDSLLSRLLETSIEAGRRSRAARSLTGRSDAGLAGRALDWLTAQGTLGAGGRLLIVGAGRMGELLAGEARLRQIETTIASRDDSRAAALAESVSGRSIALVTAARAAASCDGVAIALAGPWPHFKVDWALPPIVDLSSPPAIAAPGGTAYLDIDSLHRWAGTTGPTADQLAYSAAANVAVERAAGRFERWLGRREAAEPFGGRIHVSADRSIYE
jgi:glutamyl-tRNA reductase